MQTCYEVVGLSADRSTSASRTRQRREKQNFDRNEDKTIRFVRKKDKTLIALLFWEEKNNENFSISEYSLRRIKTEKMLENNLTQLENAYANINTQNW